MKDYSRLSAERVREIIGEPDDDETTSPTIGPHFRRFIAHSPFLCMSTADASGNFDCSPRGDGPGFVKVLDERTLAIPDRRGNKYIKSFGNLAQNPGIGLIFLVPGHRETFRVNGKAYLTDDADVLARMQTQGRTPSLAIIVDVEEAFVHCGRAILRSRLWEMDSRLLASHVPSMGEMAVEQYGGTGSTEGFDAEAEAAYGTLY